MQDVREALIREIKLNLGDGIIDLELDPDHYDFALTAAIERYRQRSSNALEESFVFLDVQKEIASYTLPKEVQEVRTVYRSGMGASSGAQIDPFSLAFTNNLYTITNPGGLGGSGTGFLATYDAAMQYRELVGRMFGRDVLFTWDPVSKRIMFHRKFLAQEEVVLHVYNVRPEHIIFNDPYARPWLRDWASAKCKQMIGEGRAKFSGGLGGPQGGVSLNGPEMKQEAKEEMERLENEIQNFMEGGGHWPFAIG